MATDVQEEIAVTFGLFVVFTKMNPRRPTPDDQNETLTNVSLHSCYVTANEMSDGPRLGSNLAVHRMRYTLWAVPSLQTHPRLQTSNQKAALISGVDSDITHPGGSTWLPHPLQCFSGSPHWPERLQRGQSLTMMSLMKRVFQGHENIRMSA